MATPLINGEAYNWSQIALVILGVRVAGITAISYSDEQAMEDYFGAGTRPVSRGYGNITSQGSITLYAEEVERLQDVAPNGRIQDIAEFDIPVTFIPKNGIPRTHTLRNCRFKNNGRDVSQGDMSIEIELPLQVSHIEWNA